MITWIYGEPCSGKSYLLKHTKCHIKLDSHELREASNNWNLSTLGREQNIKNLVGIANILDEQGFDVCVCAVTPKIKDREYIKSKIQDVQFILSSYDMANIKQRQKQRFTNGYKDSGFEY